NGTGVTWVGYKDAWSGIANVYVDGALKGTADLYSPSDTAQASLYTVTGLVSGSHTLVIEVAGQRNPLSAGLWIWVDAFDISTATGSSAAPTPAPPNPSDPVPSTTPPPAPTPTTPPPPTPTPIGPSSYRVEQTNSAVQWSGNWSLSKGSFNSGGSAKLAMHA